MDLGLTGRTALVLGAGSGLGAAIARSLALEGAQVALAGRTPAKLDQTRAAIEAEVPGARLLVLPWDLGDLSVIEARVTAIEQALGPVDILVNNTGGPPPTTAAGQAPELWAQQFQAMVMSVIAITDRVLPGMRQRRFGRILTSTSSGVVAPIANLGLSNALRSTLVAWSKTLAREVAAEGITANIVVPGRIATERLQFLDTQKAARTGRAVEDVTAESVASIPAGRIGEPQEYGDVVTFLASARASYVTGSVVRVDGGMITSL
ncbi:3-oxoacyl-[acyl-carrier protein] reductase [Sphaerotilus hippei]|uniref:3-oxoacyl-[acyl-carrier protein] reductase n=1 Tax=Sphaerotilus hippei TaxID=744406 RepID=A0A318GX44_9BURK|nr:SDR family oxidoreductase [Sphaerotilus hippei]PXW92335.1 3-oxoacyl-[acyl-carrier protein] reductase [Sphaerotilus hippei]